MMSHPTFIICPSETVLLSFPICLCSFFCLSNCKKETLFKIGKYDMNPQTPEMLELCAKLMHRATLNSFLFASFQVESSLSRRLLLGLYELFPCFGNIFSSYQAYP